MDLSRSLPRASLRDGSSVGIQSVVPFFLLQKSRELIVPQIHCKRGGLIKWGRVTTSHSFCPDVAPTATHPFPSSLPTSPYSLHPCSQKDPEKPLCWVPARNRLGAPGGLCQPLPTRPQGVSPAPPQGLGEGRLALPGSPALFPGCCCGKFMSLSGLGTDPTLKRKKKERKK